MLNTVFKDAIINREKTLSILKGPEYEKIIQKAKGQIGAVIQQAFSYDHQSCEWQCD